MPLPDKTCDWSEFCSVKRAALGCDRIPKEVDLNRSSLRAMLAAILILCSPYLAAHPLHGDSFYGGILHPLGGWDHLLAMMGIGLWSSQQAGRLRWMILLGFTTLMGISAWAALLGNMPARYEEGVAASVLLIGLLIGLSFRAKAWIGLSITAAFAVFHGFAHGGEMPHSADALHFGLGFLCSTMLLQALGFAVGKKLSQNTSMVQIIGAAIAGCGGLLLASAWQ